MFDASQKLADARRLAKLVLEMESSGVMNNMRAKTVIEILGLAHGLNSEPKTEGREGPRKERKDFLPGEAFLIDKVVFLSVHVPPMHKMSLKAAGLLPVQLSVVIGCIGPVLMDGVCGKICGGGSAVERYPVVEYTPLESGVRLLNDVQPGEMFIHGDFVYLKCRYKSLSYITALDGSMFTDAPSFGFAGDTTSVTILKPEFHVEGRK